MLKPIAVFLFGLALTAISIKDTIDDRAFEDRGKTAVVDPIDHYTEVTKKRRNTVESVSYKADLTFHTESGQAITVNKKISEEALQNFQAGRPVTIRYLPDNPLNTRLGNETRLGGAGSIGFWTLIALVGAFWFRRRWLASRSAA